MIWAPTSSVGTTSIDNEFKPAKGLNESIIRQMSEMKNEPKWMLDNRLKAYQRFLRKPIPQWGGGGALNDIDFDDIYYYIKPSGGQSKDWDMVPEGIKATYEKLGIPQAERKYLAGVTAQYECLRGDVRVYTVDRGMVAIKEIEAGDRVFSLNERTGNLEVHQVKSSQQTDVRQTYRVEVDGGRVRLRHRQPPDPHPGGLGQGRQPPAGNRGGGGRGSSRRRQKSLSPTDPRAPRRTSPRRPRPRWPGCSVMPSGAATSTPTRVELSLVADGDTAAVLHGTIGSLFTVSAKVGGGKVAIDHKPMIRWFQRNGLVGDRDVRRVPAWVFGLPITERAAFLRGLLDGSRERGLIRSAHWRHLRTGRVHRAHRLRRVESISLR